MITGGGGEGVAGVLIFLGRGAAAFVLSVVLPVAVAVVRAVVAVLLLLLLLLDKLLLLLLVEEVEEPPLLLFCCCACCLHFALRFLNHTWGRKDRC